MSGRSSPESENEVEEAQDVLFSRKIEIYRAIF